MKMKQHRPRAPKSETVSRASPRDLNPLSSTGSLGFLDFMFTLLALGTALSYFGMFMQSQVESARGSSDLRLILTLYGIWLAGSSLGFIMVTNAFLKRWMAILDLGQLPRWVRGLMRFALLSPLLSLWATGLTLLFSRFSPLQDGISRWRAVLIVAVSLILFHLGFLLHQVQSGVFMMAPGGIHLRAMESLPLRSLGKTLASDVRLPALPGERFYLHLYPYLNPGAKYAASLGSDALRAKTIADEAKKPGSLSCSENRIYLGSTVFDCFMMHYRRAGAQRPFASPAIAFLFETTYRQSTMMSVQVAMRNPEAYPTMGIASMLLVIRNLLSILEPGEELLPRASFFSPQGLIDVFASPEIPVLEFGQDLQNYLFTDRLLPILKAQVDGIDEMLSRQGGALAPQNRQEIETEISLFKKRIARLESDPFRLTWKPSRPVAPE